MSKKKHILHILKDRNNQITIGVVLVVISLCLFLSCISYIFHWQTDQSKINNLFNGNKTVNNIFGKLGNYVGHLFVYKSFGISTLLPILFLCVIGLKLISKTYIFPIKKLFININIYCIILPVLFAFTLGYYPILSGVLGYELNSYLSVLLGKMGVGILLFLCIFFYIVFLLQIPPQKIMAYTSKYLSKLKNKKNKLDRDITFPTEPITPKKEDTIEKIYNKPLEVDLNQIPTIKEQLKENPPQDKQNNNNTEQQEQEEYPLEVKEIVEEETVNKVSGNLVKKQGKYDPKLDLSQYEFPPLILLREYKNEGIIRNDRELEENRNRIRKTLKNYKIEISSIVASIGSTVTLYEIIPAPGIKISRIKNLEDDIALSLSALGIRIIAPMPGKGTIGIEVPNRKPTIVSIRSVITSKKFQNIDMDLPCALGKNISNETVIIDLVKMPHLLMAGATGQGKSVGLNAILTSLLYKKHPAELKFVLVDPKKVELTLFNKIERHYLAKLPHSEDAIITDTTKVIHTLNSLCIEMDERYELLKDAMVRNIKEYNHKFINRKLNPENGHKFLPYIVLVIDEFADLIMTAGKEVETPIARLAQLARAIGIHLIVATQRPSVNVITGIIKANFPARIAFRVTSKIDSRTILDTVGADQLIGKGDMLYTSGNDITRIQCAFVDTPEVEKITDFIGAQRGYPNALLLPEYESEEGEANDLSSDDIDSKFEEAARIVVTTQQGSTSMLQRKLKLGYNRAGRIVDQLEAAGIIGPFEGSKARKVLIKDETELNDKLNKND